MKPELEARFLTARRAVIARRFSGLNEMQRRDLDFAVLHHHGDWDTEYLNNHCTVTNHRHIFLIADCL